MLTRSTRLRRAVVAGVAATATVVLSACGGDDSSGSGMDHGSGMASAPASPSARAVFNDADVMFAQMMIQHHRQAIEMAEMADTRAADADVKSLAAKIKAAQQPEIETLTGWLNAWGKPASMPSGSMDTGDMGHSPMPGMMSDTDMKKLTEAEGAEFDKQFLTMMTAHHKGAITMAEDEVAKGSNPEAKALAAKIVQDQQAEIAEMQGILDRL
jgi:uncharacterized protein (DUF305 family)